MSREVSFRHAPRELKEEVVEHAKAGVIKELMNVVFSK